MKLVPKDDRLLVELLGAYQHVATVEQKYETKTSGICVAIPANIDLPELRKLVGKQIFWQEYKDGKEIVVDGKKYAFIKIEDVDGYLDE
jgi:co-chaperonin GroES (HSP10)